jgi:hypothetical protein
MTMEQKIRMIAGTFVLASLALGWWVSPYWFLFTAFVGAGSESAAILGHQVVSHGGYSPLDGDSQGKQLSPPSPAADHGSPQPLAAVSAVAWAGWQGAAVGAAGEWGGGGAAVGWSGGRW